MSTCFTAEQPQTWFRRIRGCTTHSPLSSLFSAHCWGTIFAKIYQGNYGKEYSPTRLARRKCLTCRSCTARTCSHTVAPSRGLTLVNHAKKHPPKQPIKSRKPSSWGVLMVANNSRRLLGSFVFSWKPLDGCSYLLEASTTPPPLYSTISLHPHGNTPQVTVPLPPPPSPQRLCKGHVTRNKTGFFWHCMASASSAIVGGRDRFGVWSSRRSGGCASECG